MKNSPLKKGLYLIWLLACSTAATPMARAGRYDERASNQENRIENGVASGQLTGAEAKHLKQAEKNIQLQVAKDKADGHFTKKEKANIEKRQNAASNKIWSQKHDAQTAAGKTRMMNSQRRRIISPAQAKPAKALGVKIKKH